jgi:hypothetical protein
VLPSSLSFICPREDMSSEPPQRTSTLSAQEMSGNVGQCRQDTSSNSVLKTLSEGHSVDIRGICGHLWTYLNFAACPDKLACPQGFLSFVLSEDMSRTNETKPPHGRAFGIHVCRDVSPRLVAPDS